MEAHDGYIKLALDGLEVIANLVSSATAEKAAEALTGVRSVVNALHSAGAGAVSPDDVRAEFARLQASIAINDSKADAALQARFVADETGEGVDIDIDVAAPDDEPTGVGG